MNNKESRAMTEANHPVAPAMTPTLHPLAEPIEAGQLLACSFDASTPRGKALLSKCLGPADVDLAGSEGRVYSATDICVYMGRVPLRDTGEIVDMPCVRVILSSGETLGWCSGIASEQFRRAIMSIEGTPPWFPPIKFRVNRYPSKSHPGGSWYSFVLDGQE